MAEIWLTSLDGTLRLPLYAIGPYGADSDLSYTFRWGEGSCGLYEATWSMSLPPGFGHPLLRRGSLVEIMEGSCRIGCPLELAEPSVGVDLGEPWTFVATGIGRAVEGDNSFYSFRLSDGETTSVPSEAAAYSAANGWRISGSAASVPTSAIGGTSTTDELMTNGSLFNAAGDGLGKRWGVGSDNLLFFAADPTTPTYLVIPEAVDLGTSDEDYASVVKFRYRSSATGLFATATATNSQVDGLFGRRTYGVNRTAMGPMSSVAAQSYADGILAKAKGRLAWTNSLTVTSDQILLGGARADLSILAEDVGRGCMIRLLGGSADLLDYTDRPALDVIVSEAKLADGARSITLAPLGLSKRDLASIVEDITGYRDDA